MKKFSQGRRLEETRLWSVPDVANKNDTSTLTQIKMKTTLMFFQLIFGIMLRVAIEQMETDGDAWATRACAERLILARQYL